MAKASKKYELRLYIAGNTPKSNAAIRNLKKYCEEHLQGEYEIEVIDLLISPQLAEGDQILAIPTLVKRYPNLYGKLSGICQTQKRFLLDWISDRSKSNGNPAQP